MILVVRFIFGPYWAWLSGVFGCCEYKNTIESANVEK
jgi:hypothetical protein